jgi:3-methyladenine DNA glycosylase Mpg
MATPHSMRTQDPPLFMLFSKEYVGYLAREVTKKLIAGKIIETEARASGHGESACRAAR